MVAGARGCPRYALRRSIAASPVYLLVLTRCGVCAVFSILWTGAVHAVVTGLLCMVSAWTFPLLSIGGGVIECGRLRPHLGTLLPHTRCLCSNARSLCRHRSALVAQIDWLAPHHEQLDMHSGQLVPRLPEICRHLDSLPVAEMAANIEHLGALHARPSDHERVPSSCPNQPLASLSLSTVCVSLTLSRVRAGAHLDVLLEVGPPQLQPFLTHVVQHIEALAPLLEVLAEHVDELGACCAPPPLCPLSRPAR